jgi:uncharacterized protein (TIGR02996 family)
MAKKKSRVRQTKKERRVLTPEDYDFIRQILASPDDDAPRLAYADWLEQHGERARAKFIRYQIEGARLAPETPWWKQGGRRAADLLRAHLAEWSALPPEVARVAWLGRFERGFPAWARCTITHFPEDTAPHLPYLWQVAPITHLELLEYNAATWDVDFTESWIDVKSYKALAKFPELAHLRSLSMAECSIKANHLKALLASPHLINLRELDLFGNRLGDAAARMVAEWPRSAGLTHLNLSENYWIGDRGAEALAQSPHLSNLKTLLLRCDRIGEAGGRALAHSPHLANLEKLDLGGNRLGAAEGELRQRFGNRLTL